MRVLSGPPGVREGRVIRVDDEGALLLDAAGDLGVVRLLNGTLRPLTKRGLLPPEATACSS